MVTACNADLGHPCDANDGEPCGRCAQYEREIMAAAKREFAASSPEERNRDSYRREMIDAGRGHLLYPHEDR